ncbi:hypothetical protein GCM10007216_18570 [Thalassobacillus devorans]|uniref:Apea-like HEPN domain-containing protein n=1 Tax=Thalassobacillus devorans TaxID=279813 RepID=A0ABQ1NZ68_9BACI|nr:hypothetical protein [Thalassobacillus devorans]NIK28200.1 hypothetical protein [Thalassobacillus devorans]GGC88107.1 hypothetical protein GCM10007216_18570 [Thalassobacillus devorans]
MNINQVEKEIRSHIRVTQQTVILAKKFILNEEGTIEVNSSLERFTTSQGYPKISRVVIHNSVPIEEQIKQASGYLSRYIAYSQAILELVHSNYLFPTSQQLFPFGGNLDIPWTTVVPGAGGSSSSWRFSDFIIPVPAVLKKSMVKNNTKEFTLFDVDLFISQLNIPNAHEDVIEAINDTISCFKKELYRPSLTMLGKAVEGAWIELGISLCDYAISKGLDDEKNNQLKEKLMGQDSFVYKVDKVIKLYSSHYKDWFNELRRITSIQPAFLEEIRIWTDVIREARNAIHFGATINSENNYEKTSVLLLAAISNFKTLYYLKQTADDALSQVD